VEFASIYYLKEMGILEALTFSNELISRDESLHTEFAVLLFSYLKEKPTQSVVHAMFEEAVQIEIEFICSSVPCGLLGLNSQLMGEYIKYVADRLLSQLGYEKKWNIGSCPLDFMNRISLENKTNFFDARVSDYSKASINNERGLLRFGGDEF
jgi:ribonucleoside-diphosphate reductase subunit M2